jgi:hypothetical protein
MSGNSSNKNLKTNPKSRFSLVENYQECLAVLDEFVRDVEAAGESSCEGDWPDLFRTYLKARHIVRDTDRAEGPHDEPADPKLPKRRRRSPRRM